MKHNIILKPLVTFLMSSHKCTLFTMTGITVYSSIRYEFGLGSGAVFISNLLCNGSYEADLLECPHTVDVGSSCTTHSRDVGVRCERKYGNDRPHLHVV